MQRSRLIDQSQYRFRAAGQAGVRIRPPRNHLMLDILVLALGLGFFAVSIAYAYACERL
jgi:hypothetical protein